MSRDLQLPVSFAVHLITGPNNNNDATKSYCSELITALKTFGINDNDITDCNFDSFEFDCGDGRIIPINQYMIHCY